MKLKYKWYSFKNEIRYKFQRLIRGYSDYDVWDIDLWFLNVMPQMLKQLKDTTHSAPLLPGTTMETCHEEWERILDRMIFLLNEMDEDKCSYKNPYEEEWEKGIEERFASMVDGGRTPQDKELFEKWRGEEQNKYKYIQLCKEEFFDLFSKYFYSLWD